MKVKELVAELQKIDQELEVILQKDSEGNGYSPLAGMDDSCFYVAENTWSGTVYGSDEDPEDYMEPEEWENVRSKGRCCILFPIN